MEILYSCDAQGKSPRDAALAFVREYWAEPRKLCKWGHDHNSFQVVRGTRTYLVKLVPEERGIRPAVYQVVVA